MHALSAVLFYFCRLKQLKFCECFSAYITQIYVINFSCGAWCNKDSSLLWLLWKRSWRIIALILNYYQEKRDLPEDGICQIESLDERKNKIRSGIAQEKEFWSYVCTTLKRKIGFATCAGSWQMVKIFIDAFRME